MVTIQNRAPISRTAHGMAVRRGEDELSDVLDAWIVQTKADGWLKTRSGYRFEGADWVGELQRSDAS